MRDNVSSANVFFDSCILVYSITRAERRQTQARELLSKGGVISVQCLNELANVAHRKLKLSWREIDEASKHIQSFCGTPRTMNLETHVAAVQLANRFNFQFYDCLIIASALQASCTILYTEDLQHRQTIGPLTIMNPFLPAPTN